MSQYLTFTTLWANSADDKLEVIFSDFFEKIGYVISCKMSSKETICMQCQSLFHGTNKKNVSKFCL